MVNVIIFSKNRACQLELLLRSLCFRFRDINVCNIKIIYLYTNNQYKMGYQKLIKKYTKFTFIFQTDFKADLINNINKEIPTTMFLMDDNVFIKDFNFENETAGFYDNINLSCIALRLSPIMDYCYTQGKFMKKPDFKITQKEYYIWTWKNCELDWGYIMSLDGSIFRTKDIYGLLISLNYKNPNTLEGLLSKNPINKIESLCYKENKIINIPINKVQDVCENIFGKKHAITAEELNNKYLDGEIISLNDIEIIKSNSPHIEIPIKFVKEDYVKF